MSDGHDAPLGEGELVAQLPEVSLPAGTPVDESMDPQAALEEVRRGLGR